MNGGRSLENMTVCLRTELDHGHIVLTDAGMPLDDTFGVLSLAERIKILAQRVNDIKKALKEIRRLTALALSNIINTQEYWSVGEAAEIETLDSIQIKLQAILRNVDEALEAYNADEATP